MQVKDCQRHCRFVSAWVKWLHIQYVSFVLQYCTRIFGRVCIGREVKVEKRSCTPYTIIHQPLANKNDEKGDSAGPKLRMTVYLDLPILTHSPWLCYLSTAPSTLESTPHYKYSESLLPTSGIKGPLAAGAIGPTSRMFLTQGSVGQQKALCVGDRTRRRR